MAGVSSEVRILLSARDAGAAGHISAIGRAANERGLTTHVVAQSPAIELIRADGLDVASADIWLDCELPAGQIEASLLPLVSRAIHAFSPDCLVLGQSQRAEFSIDDWLLAAAGDIPTVVMQDFWGEVKTIRGRTADLFLVLDSYADRVTREKTAAKTAIVGSPKHARYKDLDTGALRREGRRATGLQADDFVIGYFGQDLNRLEGYRSTVSDIAKAVRAQPGAKLLYRPHPREDYFSIEQTKALLSAEGVRTVLFPRSAIEQALATVDVVISCFSTCGYDALYLSRNSRAFDLIVVYADYHPQIKRYWTEHARINEFPAVVSGAALRASGLDHLIEMLTQSRNPVRRAAISKRILDAIPDPEHAPAASAEAILSLLGLEGDDYPVRRVLA